MSHRAPIVVLIALATAAFAEDTKPDRVNDAVVVESLRPSVPGGDPLALLDEARTRVHADIRAYRCTFRKQERIAGDLKDPQRADVRYRAEPRSVYMHFQDGIDEVRRCAWVRGRDRDRQGRERALVEPAGAVLRLVAPEVKIPIRGERARAASRHCLDDFGFHAVLDRLIADNARFGGAVRWEHGGAGTFDGRATQIVIRRLPYEGLGGRYPDAMMIIHLDAEWLAPVLIESYADPQRATLLGRYATSGVQLNPDLESEAFELLEDARSPADTAGAP